MITSSNANEVQLMDIFGNTSVYNPASQNCPQVYLHMCLSAGLLEDEKGYVLSMNTTGFTPIQADTVSAPNNYLRNSYTYREACFAGFAMITTSNANEAQVVDILGKTSVYNPASQDVLMSTCTCVCQQVYLKTKSSSVSYTNTTYFIPILKL